MPAVELLVVYLLWVIARQLGSISRCGRLVSLGEPAAHAISVWWAGAAALPGDQAELPRIHRVLGRHAGVRGGSKCPALGSDYNA